MKDRAFYCLGTEGMRLRNIIREDCSYDGDFYAFGKNCRWAVPEAQSNIFQFQGLVFIRKCCFSQPEKHGDQQRKQKMHYKKIKPLSKKYGRGGSCRTVLLSLYCSHNGDMTTETMQRLEMQELETAISPVTAWYYSMDFRSGKGDWRKVITGPDQKSGQEFLRFMMLWEPWNRCLYFWLEQWTAGRKYGKGRGYYRQSLRKRQAVRIFSVRVISDWTGKGKRKWNYKLFQQKFKSDSDYAGVNTEEYLETIIHNIKKGGGEAMISNRMKKNKYTLRKRHILRKKNMSQEK